MRIVDIVIAHPSIGARFMSVKQFQQQFALSRSKSYDLVATGEVRSVRVGKRIVIPVAEANAYEDRLLQQLAS